MTGTRILVCVDCQKRPVPKKGDRIRCIPCNKRFLENERKQEALEAENRTRGRWSNPSNWTRYSRIYIWKGHLVGLWSGCHPEEPIRYTLDGFFYLKYQPTEGELEKLGTVLLDMNIYQPAFEAWWIKRFKAMILASTKREGERLNWDGMEE
tara:strand:+ start:68 stop:523 length:456 start_codon:yes stop_codon:yes gene_type:complete